MAGFKIKDVKYPTNTWSEDILITVEFTDSDGKSFTQNYREKITSLDWDAFAATANSKLEAEISKREKVKLLRKKSQAFVGKEIDSIPSSEVNKEYNPEPEFAEDISLSAIVKVGSTKDAIFVSGKPVASGHYNGREIRIYNDKKEIDAEVVDTIPGENGFWVKCSNIKDHTKYEDYSIEIGDIYDGGKPDEWKVVGDVVVEYYKKDVFVSGGDAENYVSIDVDVVNGSAYEFFIAGDYVTGDKLTKLKQYAADKKSRRKAGLKKIGTVTEGKGSVYAVLSVATSKSFEFKSNIKEKYRFVAAADKVSLKIYTDGSCGCLINKISLKRKLF